MSPHFATTSALSIALREHGPASGRPLMLLHGWPDNAETWDQVTPHLAAAGYRVIVPSLRGYGATTFRDASTPRSGQVVALARDAFALADALGIGRFVLIGHDWGARAVYPAAILAPERLDGILSLSAPWSPRSAPTALSLPQAQAFWYQWFFCTPHGEAQYRADPTAFERRMWDTWSPAGWYSEADWAGVARDLDNPDHADVVIDFYRSRWGLASPDPAYDLDETRFAGALTISVPALLLHGTLDSCCLPQLTEGMDAHFTAGFSRQLVDRAGHFPQREAPAATADVLLQWLSHL